MGVGAQKQRASNPVPLSTASTAASSPLVHSAPPGFSEPAPAAAPAGTYVNDCPPSPSLTKRLLAQAQTRKRAGRHNLVSVPAVEAGCAGNKRILRLSPPHSPEKQPIDRWGLSDDLYESLLSAATQVKRRTGQHTLERRRLGLSGAVEPVLVIKSSSQQRICHQPPCTVSLFSPDPSLF